jgi:hypothetical protein
MLHEPDDIISQTFVANRGNSAHLHYDGDQRCVLMYQVFGRKRYTMIHPRETWKMHAVVDPRMQRTSSLFVEHLSDEDKLEFFRYANAYDCVLEPGDSLLMPMMWWHYVEYLDTAMSVSFRLGRNRYNRFLAENVPIPNVYLQAIATLFVDAERVDAPRERAFVAIQEACAASYLSEQARLQSLDRVCLAAYERLYPDRPLHPCTLLDMQRRELVQSAGVAVEDSRSATSGRPEWAGSDRPVLAAGVQVLSPTNRPNELVVARNNALEAKLSPNPSAPWLFPLLTGLSDAKGGATVADLAVRHGADLARMRAVLSQLSDRGWIITLPATEVPAAVTGRS